LPKWCRNGEHHAAAQDAAAQDENSLVHFIRRGCGYTLCRATVGKAVNGQGKHPRARRSKALLKFISLGVKPLG
jgi:hypothetical protein